MPGAFGEVDDVVDLATRSDGESVVAVGGYGYQLQVGTVTGDEPPEPIYDGVELTSPSWDRNDVIWAVNRPETGGELVAMRPDGTELEVRSEELEDKDVANAAISPDGTKMALVADGVAYLGVIVHDSENRERVSVERLRRIGPEGEAIDVDWSDAEHVALLSGDEQDTDDDVPVEPEVYLVNTSGSENSSRGPVPGATSVAADAAEGIVVATEEDLLLVHESRNRWVDVDEGSAPAFS